MGFQDRHYYRDSSSGPSGPLMWLLTGSVPLFTIFGIRVRIHVAMLLFIFFELLFAGSAQGIGVQNALLSMTILFASVLLHEFGHCFGARWVGGEADEILMWPLGGLAYTNPPMRPAAHLVTTAAGPAVNVAICLITGTAVAIMAGSISAIPWFPLLQPLKNYVPSGWVYYVWWVFLVNYALFMFNMCLVFYPFDAGRIIQELLWFRIGYYRSMLFATRVGMFGAVVAAAAGIVLGWFLLIFIAAFGFYECYRQRQMLLASGPEEYSDTTDYSAAYEPYPRPKRRGKWAARRAMKLARAEREERQRIDEILAKVSAQGMQSLSWSERRALKKATEHQRKRDEEVSRLRRP